MNIQLYLQNPQHYKHIPCENDFISWCKIALDRGQVPLPDSIEILIRIVNKEESAQLNEQFRHKRGPTNILSFSYDHNVDDDPYELGDLVICADVVEEEAQTQQKKSRDHWAHLTIHGILHLLGYDHIEPNDAEQMEGLEITILQQLNIANPYE